MSHIDAKAETRYQKAWEVWNMVSPDSTEWEDLDLSYRDRWIRAMDQFVDVKDTGAPSAEDLDAVVAEEEIRRRTSRSEVNAGKHQVTDLFPRPVEIVGNHWIHRDSLDRDAQFYRRDEIDIWANSISEKWQGLAADMYQFAGAHDAPELWLDVLSAAANGEEFSTDNLLPYAKDSDQCEGEPCWFNPETGYRECCKKHESRKG